MTLMKIATWLFGVSSSAPTVMPSSGSTEYPSFAPTAAYVYPSQIPSSAPTSSVNVSATYYTDLQDEQNPSWYDLKETLDVGTNSLSPSLGSTIKVNHAKTKKGLYADREIARPLAVHVPTNSFVGPSNFDTISRWYQEDDNTQIFRLFPGDDSVRNSRANAPRSEAFGLVSWKRGDGWYEWSGRYTFLKVRPGAVLQIKHNSTYWSMQLILEENHDGTFDLFYVKLRDRAAKTLLVPDVVGSGVDVKVLDDGENHKVYIDQELMVENSMTDRPEEDDNRARWGLYSPRSAMDREILILVTGAYVGPYRLTQQDGDKPGDELSLVPPGTLDDDEEINEEIPTWQGFDDEPDPDILLHWNSDPSNDGYGYV